MTTHERILDAVAQWGNGPHVKRTTPEMVAEIDAAITSWNECKPFCVVAMHVVMPAAIDEIAEAFRAADVTWINDMPVVNIPAMPEVA